jgi:hypothetical protein
MKTHEMSPRAPRRTSRLRRLAPALGCAALALAFGVNNCPFADEVNQYLPGTGAFGDALSAVGEPAGEGLFNGSFDTCTLGVSGSLTLQLSSRGFDGPGTDLIVCENPFYVVGTSGVFIEAMFVEVSTDGVEFARFPTAYTGPTGPFNPALGQPVAGYRGFAGVLPVSANSSLGIPALDVVAAGGDAFDYADLADDPAVLAGDVDLADIHHVRLVDVKSGTELDTAGNTVWDCGLNGQASADVDAIVAVNSFCVPQTGRPAVELSLASNGFLTIRIEDEDGFQDIKQGVTASVNGLPLNFWSLLPFFAITGFDASGITLVTGPIPPGLFPVTLKVSARDTQGQFGGDALTLP